MDVRASPAMPLAHVPAHGTWIAVPDDLGFVPGKVQPDTYIVCLDNARTLLPTFEAKDEDDAEMSASLVTE